MADDFRVDCLFEAQRCLKLVGKQNLSQQEFWANLLGGVANAAIASIPDSVVSEYRREQDKRARKLEIIHDHLTDRLGAN